MRTIKRNQPHDSTTRYARVMPIASNWPPRSITHAQPLKSENGNSVVFWIPISAHQTSRIPHDLVGLAPKCSLWPQGTRSKRSWPEPQERIQYLKTLSTNERQNRADSSSKANWELACSKNRDASLLPDKMQCGDNFQTHSVQPPSAMGAFSTQSDASLTRPIGNKRSKTLHRYASKGG